MQLPTIPELVMQHLPLRGDERNTLGPDDVLALAGEHPFAVEYYLLLHAHARAACAHLGPGEQFLFHRIHRPVVPEHATTSSHGSSRPEA